VCRNMTEPLHLDAVGQAELLRSKKISPTELVDLAIAAVERVNPQLNAVIHPRFERARSEARSASPTAVGGIAATDGAFTGVPIVVKDLNCQIKGEPYHLGTRFLKVARRVHHDRSYERAGIRKHHHDGTVGLWTGAQPMEHGTFNGWK
jgi:Asp-tRNA(Asn)/Glu-tRNA(Gln) amidotransferase A subunit family amidase